MKKIMRYNILLTLISGSLIASVPPKDQTPEPMPQSKFVALFQPGTVYPVPLASAEEMAAHVQLGFHPTRRPVVLGTELMDAIEDSNVQAMKRALKRKITFRPQEKELLLKRAREIAREKRRGAELFGWLRNEWDFAQVVGGAVLFALSYSMTNLFGNPDALSKAEEALKKATKPVKSSSDSEKKAYDLLQHKKFDEIGKVFLDKVIRYGGLFCGVAFFWRGWFSQHGNACFRRAARIVDLLEKTPVSEDAF